MRFQRVLTEFRELLTQLSHEVEMSVSLGHTDIAHISEVLFLRILNALYGWRLKDMNADQPSFPAIDLADESAGVAVQITATPTSAKIKSTISKFIEHELHLRYPRLIVLVITRRQDSYQQQPIDAVVEARMKFDVARDIIDCRTLARQASKTKPHLVEVALSYLKAYLRDRQPDLDDESFDPPATPVELLTPNLLPIRFPDTVYVADLVVSSGSKHLDRKDVQESLSSQGITVPFGYEIRGHQLLTFWNLSDSSPYDTAIDPGTVTPLAPEDYYSIDLDHQGIFRSLLRLLLQDNLFERHVLWSRESKVFFFCPNTPEQNRRVERWRGHRLADRTVFERKMNRDDATKVLSTVHLAFSVRFLLCSKRWYAVLVPDWYFSFGDDFSRSLFSDEQLTKRKGLESEHSVHNTFRFLAWWLSARTGDLWAPLDQRVPRLEFGEEVRVPGGRPLDEEAWRPLKLEDSWHTPSLLPDEDEMP